MMDVINCSLSLLISAPVGFTGAVKWDTQKVSGGKEIAVITFQERRYANFRQKDCVHNGPGKIQRIMFDRWGQAICMSLKQSKSSLFRNVLSKRNDNERTGRGQRAGDGPHRATRRSQIHQGEGASNLREPEEQLTKPGSSSSEPICQRALERPPLIFFICICGASWPGFKSYLDGTWTVGPWTNYLSFCASVPSIYQMGLLTVSSSGGCWELSLH